MCIFGSNKNNSAQVKELTTVNQQLQQQLQEKTKALSDVNNVLNTNTLTKGDPVQNVDRVLNNTQKKRTIKTLTIPQQQTQQSGINIPR